jgi:hypothetical protein
VAKFRKKPTLIEATQWFVNGDHPEDNSELIERPGAGPVLSEGKVVGFFRAQHIPDNRFCPECGNTMHKHGWLAKREERICPGDYVVTGGKDNYYRLKAEEFEALYEPYDATQDKES